MRLASLACTLALLAQPALASDDVPPSNYVHVTNSTSAAPGPSSASDASITPVVSAAAESNHVICSAACNLYSAYVTTGSVGGYFMVFNATAAPGDGAVTPIECVPVPANANASITFSSGPPDRYSTGVTVVFSSTGCFTKTASATAFFKARKA